MQKSSHFRAGGILALDRDAQAIADAVLRDISLGIYKYDEPLEVWDNEGGACEKEA
jgi:hypothetical protein